MRFARNWRCSTSDGCGSPPRAWPRHSDPRRSAAKTDLAAVSEEVQRSQGLYMIGQVACLPPRGCRDGRSARRRFRRQPDRPGKPGGQNSRARESASLRDQDKMEIAIIGMACRFPQARDLPPATGRTSATASTPSAKCPPERWRIADFFSEDRRAPRPRLFQVGRIPRTVFFDPMKWGIPPASLRHIEPMQLLVPRSTHPGRWWTPATPSPRAGPGGRPYPRERAGVLFAVPGSHEFGSAYSFRTMMRHYLPKVDGLTADLREQIYTDLENPLARVDGGLVPRLPWQRRRRANRPRAWTSTARTSRVDAACAASLPPCSRRRAICAPERPTSCWSAAPTARTTPSAT